MTDTDQLTRRWPHPCDACVLIAQTKVTDIYECRMEGGYGIVFRHGEGPKCVTHVDREAVEMAAMAIRNPGAEMSVIVPPGESRQKIIESLRKEWETANIGDPVAMPNGVTYKRFETVMDGQVRQVAANGEQWPVPREWIEPAKEPIVFTDYYVSPQVAENILGAGNINISHGILATGQTADNRELVSLADAISAKCKEIEATGLAMWEYASVPTKLRCEKCGDEVDDVVVICGIAKCPACAKEGVAL